MRSEKHNLVTLYVNILDDHPKLVLLTSTEVSKNNVVYLLVFDPLQLPLDDHLSQVHSQLPLFYSHTWSEAQTLHCTDHVLHQVVSDRVIHLGGGAPGITLKKYHNAEVL